MLLQSVIRAATRFLVEYCPPPAQPPLCWLASTTLCAGPDYATDLISLTTGLQNHNALNHAPCRVVPGDAPERLQQLCTDVFGPCPREIWRTGEYQSVRRRPWQPTQSLL
ncbi:Hypothetical protein MIP_03272 [Mycobacterium intracellulare subsp. intracellulare MTCC 9506]|uniref:Uncharacterized protein n=1 Tax=Mycobacterium indicus pranii (strain DSM 45239 / MTCC 9506) TaxID=1232724 RepID=J9WDK0_MYCIP|nr:Hypothetical protein MIP_03272 [Mycobacterium intracellulare subsp. intracellulare MTCC 9506]